MQTPGWFALEEEQPQIELQKAGMRALLLLFCSSPSLVSIVLWLRYFLPITITQSYHVGYFGFAVIPGILLTLLLFGIRSGPLWLRISSGLLMVAGIPLWLLSIAVVANDFRIH